MICKKDANYPYPILTNGSNGYKDCSFIFDVKLEENTHNYIFEIEYEIDSSFINKLLQKGLAQLVLIIQSKDNKFYDLGVGQKYKEISKSRLSLSKRTTIQLLVQSNEELSFKDNHDLNSFYEEFKDDIIISKNSILGFSNIVTFEGSTTRPFDLFEKKVNPSIESDIEIELGNETIIINYKNEGLQFNNLPMSSTLNNPYVYMGLQKALYQFIINNSEDMDEVDIEEMNPPVDSLDFKLYNLMRRKMISELSLENIDEVIYSISDRILEKYATVVREMGVNGS